jgi:cell division septum initiation protein DivIVA
MPELPFELDDENLPGALFGYDKYSVSKLLDSIRNRFWTLWEEVAERDEKIKNLELELHRSRESQRLVGETLLAARQQAAAIREEARRSAQSLLKTARKRAEETAAQIEREASQRARELIDSAERERKALLSQAGEARAFVEQTHEQLSDFLLAAVKWYEQAKLPVEEERRREAPAAASAEGVAEGPQLDPAGVEGSPDPRVAEDA